VQFGGVNDVVVGIDANKGATMAKVEDEAVMEGTWRCSGCAKEVF